MSRISDLKNMLKERRAGFLITEVMSGSHEFEPGQGPYGEYPFEFHITWGPKSLAKWINPLSGDFMTQPLKGTVTVGGLCEKAPCTGTLEIAYWTERKIRYTFEFSVNNKAYHYVGEKVNILPWNLPVSHTTCFGTLVEKKTGKLVSRSVVFFRLWRTPRFFASFRLA